MTFNKDTVIDHIVGCMVMIGVTVFANLILTSMYTTVSVDMDVRALHSNVCFVNVGFIIPIMVLVIISYIRELLDSVIDYIRQQPNQMKYYVGGYIGMIVYIITTSLMISNTYQYTWLLITPVTMPTELVYMYYVVYIIGYWISYMVAIFSVYYSVLSTVHVFNDELAKDQRDIGNGVVNDSVVDDGAVNHGVKDEPVCDQ